MINKAQDLLRGIDIKSLSIYFFVGLGATLVEWVLFGVLTNGIAINYLLATTIAMFVSTFANWALGRISLYRRKSRDKIVLEMAQVYLASLVGWLVNMVLMWIMVGKMGMLQMLSKVIATGVTFLYNYFIRKLVIYKKD